jgi:hypothetical protein
MFGSLLLLEEKARLVSNEEVYLSLLIQEL